MAARESERNIKQIQSARENGDPRNENEASWMNGGFWIHTSNSPKLLRKGREISGFAVLHSCWEKRARFCLQVLRVPKLKHDG